MRKRRNASAARRVYCKARELRWRRADLKVNQDFRRRSLAGLLLSGERAEIVDFPYARMSRDELGSKLFRPGRGDPIAGGDKSIVGLKRQQGSKRWNEMVVQRMRGLEEGAGCV